MVTADDEVQHDEEALSSDDEQTRRRLAVGERSPAPSPDTARAVADMSSPTRSAHHDFSADEDEDEEEADEEEHRPLNPRRSEPPAADLSTVVQAVQAQRRAQRGQGGSRAAGAAPVKVESNSPRLVRRSSRLGGRGQPRK